MTTPSTARDFALTIIERTASLDGQDPMRRCVRKWAKHMIAMIDEDARVRAKGISTADVTIDDVRARIVSECEDAATWHMTPAGRAQLEALVRD
jgi:hypothetical protein